MSAIRDVPGQGQLVQVRERRWVVAEVEADELPADPLRPASTRQHLLTLRCVDDDAEPDETLQVVWEIEPGARAFDRSALPAPTALDDPRRFDAFLDAVRWGASSNADPRYLLAPFQSGVEIDWSDELHRHLRGALIDAGLCASDPLCAEHDPDGEGITLHGAACHACLFAPETSCERGNRYLDRAALAQLITDLDIAYLPKP